MTFDEWWATYDPDDVNTRADREHARMVWQAATAAERERCARVAEDTFPKIDGPGWLAQEVRRNHAREIAREILKGETPGDGT